MHEALARIAEQIEGTRVPTARGANAYRPADVDAGCDAMADRLRSAGPVDREELSGHARDARFGTTGFGRGYACEDAYEVADIEAIVARSARRSPEEGRRPIAASPPSPPSPP